MKDYQNALEDIDYVIMNDENNINAHFYKGIIYRDRGELIDALKNYDIALKLMSKNKIIDVNMKTLETDKYFYSNNKKDLNNIPKQKTPIKEENFIEENEIKNSELKQEQVVENKKEIFLENNNEKVESQQLNENNNITTKEPIKAEDVIKLDTIEDLNIAIENDKTNGIYYQKRADISYRYSKAH